MGLGVWKYKIDGETAWGHGGKLYPFISRTFYIPELGLSVAYSYSWTEVGGQPHSFTDFKASEKTVTLGKQESLVTVHGDVFKYADSAHSLSVDIRQQLLQSLVYLPASVVGQPYVLEMLKQNLQSENTFSWKDYAMQIAQVWRYPVPAK